MANFLSLDSILSAMSFHVRKWSPDLIRTQSRDLLRFLTIKLYSESNGCLNTASLTISQSALADKIGVTREWCNQLLGQLKDEGWIEYSSGRREGGLRTTCTYAIGNMMKRLLIMLSKSHAKKDKQKRDVNSPSQVFPLFSKEQKFSIPDPPNPSLSETLLRKIPLLKVWKQRGAGA